ncbi:H-NS family nucleoid-associated regulatory protein [Paraburkholderia sp. JHI2823]|uniref:H-NS family nucleoid-associated regulatory protein n=1 Tax=Paraburkholderia sp. JHI2823 TaxID=3112960 RepID=UPI0031719258
MQTLSEALTTRDASAPRPMSGEARERLIVWMRLRMARAGITPEALERALIADTRAALAVQYRDAEGNTWDGAGAMPPWLSRAVASGQSIEHFRCTAQAY